LPAKVEEKFNLSSAVACFGN